MKKFVPMMVFAFSAMGVVLGLSRLGSAYEGITEPRDFHEAWQVRRHQERRDFTLGICVGQALAQQGISVPVPEPGQSPQPTDSSTASALQEAVQTCRSEMSGSASPSPTPTETPTPTGTP